MPKGRKSGRNQANKMSTRSSSYNHQRIDAELTTMEGPSNENPHQNVRASGQQAPMEGPSNENPHQNVRESDQQGPRRKRKAVGSRSLDGLLPPKITAIRKGNCGNIQMDGKLGQRLQDKRIHMGNHSPLFTMSCPTLAINIGEGNGNNQPIEEDIGNDSVRSASIRSGYNIPLVASAFVSLVALIVLHLLNSR